MRYMLEVNDMQYRHMPFVCTGKNGYLNKRPNILSHCRGFPYIVMLIFFTAPSIFPFCFNIVKHVLDERTRNKILVFGINGMHVAYNKIE
jgi:hypothetical protein